MNLHNQYFCLDNRYDITVNLVKYDTFITNNFNYSCLLQPRKDTVPFHIKIGDILIAPFRSMNETKRLIIRVIYIYDGINKII